MDSHDVKLCQLENPERDTQGCWVAPVSSGVSVQNQHSRLLCFGVWKVVGFQGCFGCKVVEGFMVC